MRAKALREDVCLKMMCGPKEVCAWQIKCQVEYLSICGLEKKSLITQGLEKCSLAHMNPAAGNQMPKIETLHLF